MEIKIKIIEFSSDVFSKSNQLKNLIISPLFSNTNFTINIYDAISKNEEYKIKANTHIIKIGLYNGNSLLGIGEININKKSQKIKILSEDKTKNDNSLLNSSYSKIHDKDFFLTIECINNNHINDKNKNLNAKNMTFKKKKKNASMDAYKYNTKIKDDINDNTYNRYNRDKKRYSKINISLKKYNDNEDFFNKTNINYDSTYNMNSNANPNKTVTYNNRDNGINSMKSNSTIIKSDKKNQLIKNTLFPSFSYNANQNKKNKKNTIKNKNNKKNEKESNTNDIFNLSFQKELFSNGVLILSDNNNNNNNNNEDEKMNKDMYKNIDINDFDNLINDFNIIYNNVSNNNSDTPRNIKENFLLEYQFFLEKTSDIFNLYSKITSEMNSQNIKIKKDIRDYNDKIKKILKKNNILQIKKQNMDLTQSLRLNKNENLKNYFNDEIYNMNNKLSLIKNISNDFLSLTKRNSFPKENSNILLMDIFDIIINNENNREYLKDYMNKINLMIKKNKKLTNNNNDINSSENNNSDEKYNDDDDNDNDEDKKNDNKIDLEALKNKIDKLKIQYLNETTTNNFNDNEKGKKMNNYNNYKSSVSDRGGKIYTTNDKKVNKYLNVYAPKWKTKK